MENKQTQKNKAMIITSRKNHYVTVQPVIEELQKRGWKITTLRFERVWERVENALKTVKKSSIRDDTWNPSRSKDIKYEKKPLKRYLLISRLIAMFVNIFNIKKPDIIITVTDGPPLETIAILTGKLLNIPSLLLQVGVIGPNYKRDQRFLVDKIAIMGQFSKNVLVRCGVDESKLIVTGRPYYDVLAYADKLFDKERICMQLDLNQQKKIVALMTENLPVEEEKKKIYAVCKAMKELSDLQLVVHVHSADLKYSIYEKIIEKCKINAIITRNANIYEILYVCDVMITMFSTTALEAMILNKPVITVNLTGMKDPMPYAESGAAIGVYKEENLTPAIRDALYNEEVRQRLAINSKKFIYEHAYKQDGKATERVVGMIEKMIQGLRGN